MVQKNNILFLNKSLIAFIIYSAFWTSILCFTGTLTSGFHFTDDHQIITFDRNIQEKGIITATRFILNHDLEETGRFRPFYFLHRIILIRIFGYNFFLFSIYNLVLAIFTSFFLFLFINRQGYKFIHSILFPFLTLVGAQSVIWWRLGPSETIGMFFLSASLYFLVNSIYKQKKYQLNFSILLLIFSSLSKESFILFIPGYFTLFIWLKIQYDKNFTIFKVIKTNVFLLIILLILFISEVCFIIFFVGTNKIQYAGIDHSFNFLKFLKNTYYYLRHNEYVYLILVGLIVLFLNFKKDDFNKFKNLNSFSFIINSFILLSIILPQFILYDKSGMIGYYVLPLNLGFSIYIFFILRNIYFNSIVPLILKRSFLILLFFIVNSFFERDALPLASSFAKDGRATNKFLSTIVKKTNTNDSILIVLDVYESFEFAYSIHSYLNMVANRKNINFFIIDRKIKNNFALHLENVFSNDFKDLIVNDLNNSYSCIAIFPSSIDREVKIKLDSNSLYKREDFQNYTIYFK